MAELLERLANSVETAEPNATCRIDKYNCQIIVFFKNRPDTEIALLTPYAQGQIKKGKLDTDLFSEMLFSVRQIANWSVA